MRSSFKNQTIFSLAALTLVLGLAGAVAPAAAHDIGGNETRRICSQRICSRRYATGRVVRVTKGGPGNRIVAECLHFTNTFDGEFDQLAVINNCHVREDFIAR